MKCEEELVFAVWLPRPQDLLSCLALDCLSEFEPTKQGTTTTTHTSLHPLPTRARFPRQTLFISSGHTAASLVPGVISSSSSSSNERPPFPRKGQGQGTQT